MCLLAGLTGCVSVGPPPADEGIGYRQARFQQVQQIRAFRDCRDHGIELDRQAGSTGDVGRYLAAARMLEGCEADLGAAAATVAIEERMRAFGLAVQNRLKGGDVQGARATLDRFRTGFAGRDLYFEDGTSFLDTMEALLVAGGAAGRAVPATANVPTEIKDELRRVAEWRRK
jgi:hypothetical protein